MRSLCQTRRITTVEQPHWQAKQPTNQIHRIYPPRPHQRTTRARPAAGQLAAVAIDIVRLPALHTARGEAVARAATERPAPLR
jgi:hypothetical protein